MVTVKPKPRINAGNNITVCQNVPQSITATFSPNNGLISWYLLGGSGASLSTTATYNIPTNNYGSFDYVVKIDSANTCSAYDTVHVTVNPKPDAIFTTLTTCGRYVSFNS